MFYIPLAELLFKVYFTKENALKSVKYISSQEINKFPKLILTKFNAFKTGLSLISICIQSSNCRFFCRTLYKTLYKS